jgi:hypothetical protein
MFGNAEVNGILIPTQESPHHNAVTFGFKNY